MAHPSQIQIPKSLPSGKTFQGMIPKKHGSSQQNMKFFSIVRLMLDDIGC
jgi:hypothetical protein